MGNVWSSDDDDYPLILTGVRNITGGGASDSWFETQFTYTLGNTTTAVMVAIRRYNAYYPAKILFTQVLAVCSVFVNKSGQRTTKM